MKVSVIIPTYNYARFVLESVESILNQTRPAHEIIVVDDGSTDDTAQVLEPLRRSGRIRYHHQANAGLCAARNAGLSLATGDAFALCDSDDTWHPEKLRLQVAHLESHPDCGLIGTTSFSEEPERWARLGTPTVHDLPLASHLTRTRFCPSSALFRRSLWEQVGGFDPSTGGTSDRDYWIRCAAHARVARVDAPLTFYRVHGGSMTATKVDAMVASERTVLDKAFASIPAIHGRTLLRRRAYAMAHLSAAYTLWRDAGRTRAALPEFLRSLLSWPLPLARTDTKSPLYRMRFGARLLLASVGRG
ncbi:MAG: glycosyltransferase family 2 protein [Phycisphaerae bacterium]|nr:glycosyltransferase family 2 protein [Phycisphaerae bacterium]